MSVKKNPEVDNERMRILLIFLGFFIVGSLTILSFSYEEKVEIASKSKNDQAAHEIPEQLEVIEEEIEEPVVQEIQELEIPEAITEEIVEIKSEDKDETVVVEIMKIEEPPADLPPPPAEIVEYPEKEAGFPGGPAAMQK